MASAGNGVGLCYLSGLNEPISDATILAVALKTHVHTRDYFAVEYLDVTFDEYDNEYENCKHNSLDTAINIYRQWQNKDRLQNNLHRFSILLEEAQSKHGKFCVTEEPELSSLCSCVQTRHGKIQTRVKELDLCSVSNISLADGLQSDGLLHNHEFMDCENTGCNSRGSEYQHITSLPDQSRRVCECHRSTMKEWSEKLAEERLSMTRNSVPRTFSPYMRPGNSHRREVWAHPKNSKVCAEDTSNEEIITDSSISRIDACIVVGSQGLPYRLNNDWVTHICVNMYTGEILTQHFSWFRGAKLVKHIEIPESQSPNDNVRHLVQRTKCTRPWNNYQGTIVTISGEDLFALPNKDQNEITLWKIGSENYFRGCCRYKSQPLSPGVLCNGPENTVLAVDMTRKPRFVAILDASTTSLREKYPAHRRICMDCNDIHSMCWVTMEDGRDVLVAVSATQNVMKALVIPKDDQPVDQHTIAWCWFHHPRDRVPWKPKSVCANEQFIFVSLQNAGSILQLTSAGDFVREIPQNEDITKILSLKWSGHKSVLLVSHLSDGQHKITFITVN